VKPIYVCGVGLWTTGYATAQDWCENVLDEAVAKPAAALLEGPLKRRATPLTRMSVEVFQQAAEQAGRQPSTLQTVWANAHGEHTPAIKLLGMMHVGEGKLSPTQFHNSVHNTAGGYASIATTNPSASTTVSGGRELVASALIEAWCLLEASQRDVALVLADEPLLPPFDFGEVQLPLALALLLSPEPAGALATLTDIRRDTLARGVSHPRYPNLFVSAGLRLIEQIVTQQSGTVPLELEDAVDENQAAWCVDLESHIKGR
jgi:hypothetical protein